MFVLRACYALDQAKLRDTTNKSKECMSTCVDVFVKLCGKHLGKMYVPSTKAYENMFDVVRSLQRQAAKLFPHSKRPCRYLKLYFDLEELPWLTYQTRSGVIPCVARVFKILQEVNQKSRVDVMWDEDDEFALNKIQDVVSMSYIHDHMRVDVKEQDLTNYLGVLPFLEYKCEPALFSLNNSKFPTCCPNLGFLAHMTKLRELRLFSIMPKSWDFADYLKVTRLKLEYTNINDTALQRFKHVEHVTLCCRAVIGVTPTCFSKLSYLKTLRIAIYFSTSFGDLQKATWERALRLQGFDVASGNQHGFSTSWLLCATRS